jgi:hypothetical protein
VTTPSDRTNHVIQAIDGALDDVFEGPDAMRWSPDPPATPLSFSQSTTRLTQALHYADGDDPQALVDAAARSGIGTVRLPSAMTLTRALRVPPGVTVTGPNYPDPIRIPQPDVIVAGFGSIAEQQERFTEARRRIQAGMESMHTAWEEVTRVIQRLTAAFPASVLPEDPWARALRMRRERNTGPTRLSANRQRRPRRHQP